SSGRKGRGGRDRKDRGTSIRVAAGDQQLFQALKALRIRLAEDANVPPYVICHDKTLAELATKRPENTEALQDISGLGTRKIARYGQNFLDVIARLRPHPMLDNRLSATVNETLAMHLEGLGAEDIASRRRIEASTVMGHFAEAIEAGLLEAKAVIGLDEAEVDEVMDVFERLGTIDSGRLGPAHAALDGRVDYGTLKCLLAEVA
ncbi:MAG: HRDC domain-containing protein, partial [Hyphomicrobiaceae bacterium]